MTRPIDVLIKMLGKGQINIWSEAEYKQWKVFVMEDPDYKPKAKKKKKKKKVRPKAKVVIHPSRIESIDN